MKRANVGVIQAGNRPRFEFETFSQSGMIPNMVGKNFDSDNSVETCISGAVHLAHPACANCREDFLGGPRAGRCELPMATR